MSTPPAKEGNEVRIIHDETQLRGVMFFWVISSYISVAVLMVCMPLFAFVPGGLYNEEGYFNFISDGFLKHSALSSFVYGVATTCIIIVRLLAILVYISGSRDTDQDSDLVCGCTANLIDPKSRQQAYSMLLIVTVGSGIVTTRYDEIEGLHSAAAGTWIVSSLVYHALVMAFNKRFSEKNGGGGGKVAWGISLLAALAFMSMLMLFQVDPSLDHRLYAGLAEYATAEMILVMDFMLAFSIHTRFVQERP